MVQPDTAFFFTDYACRLVGMREGRWKFIHEIESGRSVLFDLECDPGETLDLGSAFPALTRACESRVKAWVAAQKEIVLRDALVGERGRDMSAWPTRRMR
jgi:hypothetical protein